MLLLLSLSFILIVLHLQENTSLKLLDLSSPHVVIGDDALQLVSHSLSRNQTLRLLSIQGWTFYIEVCKFTELKYSIYKKNQKLITDPNPYLYTYTHLLLRLNCPKMIYLQLII